MRLNNEKGAALIITLLIVFVLLTLGSVFVLRTVNEKRLVDRERMSVQAFYIGEGGAGAGVIQLDTIINTFLLNTVNATNPSLMISDTLTYVGGANGGLQFLVDYAQDSGSQQFFANDWVNDPPNVSHSPPVVTVNGNDYQYELIVTEKNPPAASGLDQWDFTYYYRVESVGTADDSSSDVLLSGDFTVQVQRDNFAKYALFTNQQTTPGGTNVWFTNNTNFAGPVHTNGRFNIALNPSGTFEGAVSQVETTTRFYNNGSTILVDADSNPGIDVPTFNAGFTRGASSISLSSSVQQQDMIDQSRGGDTSTGNGIFVANNGSALTGGIYINGDSTVAMGVDGSDRAVYTIAQGGTTKIITVESDCSQTSIETVSSGTVAYAGCPDGVDDVGTIIYADGNITDLSGTIQRDTELTIASQDDIIVEDHVRYSDYTAAVGSPGDAGYVAPNADGATNLLGIVSWNGDVRIGNTSPDNLDLHGTVLARNGIFTVDNYNQTSWGGRGTATLLGGVISDFYGAFGLFNGSTGQHISGYGRNFVYDNRMEMGRSPPYFPSLETFIAFTNDITDKIAWQEGGF